MIAFVHSWILSLIILCMVPFLVAAAAYESAVDMVIASVLYFIIDLTFHNIVNL